MKNDPIQTALLRLDDIPVHTQEGKAAFAKALAAKSNLVVAKAAKIAGTAQWLDLVPDLAAAFERMLNKGSDIDKGCAASLAISRALVGMDHDAPELYLRGIRHVQMEPVWGGSEDTAVDVRSTCAMGLANSSYPQKLRELVPLLVDTEWGARAGAIRAIGVIGSEAASLLLRFKMLTGDREPEVMSECFTAVLSVEGGEGVKLVSRFAAGGKAEIREAAILALGASRRADAVEWLLASAGRLADPDLRKCTFLAISTARTEPGIEFLLETIRKAPIATARDAVEALEIHSRDTGLREQVEAAVRSRT
jgi:HEAT repeat protein